MVNGKITKITTILTADYIYLLKTSIIYEASFWKLCKKNQAYFWTHSKKQTNKHNNRITTYNSPFGLFFIKFVTSKHIKRVPVYEKSVCPVCSNFATSKQSECVPTHIKSIWLTCLNFVTSKQSECSHTHTKLILIFGIFPNPFWLLGAIYRPLKIFLYAIPAGRGIIPLV